MHIRLTLSPAALFGAIGCVAAAALLVLGLASIPGTGLAAARGCTPASDFPIVEYPDAVITLDPDTGPPGSSFTLTLTNAIDASQSQEIEVIWDMGRDLSSGVLVGEGEIPAAEMGGTAQATAPEDTDPGPHSVTACWLNLDAETWFYRTFYPFTVTVATLTPTPTPTPALTPTPTQTSTPSPSPGAGEVMAPRALMAPEIDGECDDPVYSEAGVALLTGSSGPNVPAVLLHNGLDVFVCFSGVPTDDADAAVLRVDSDNSGGGTLGPNDYEFRAPFEGQVSVRRGNGSGFIPIDVPGADFEAAVEGESVEVRISLEWFGGYGRTDGLEMALETNGGGTVKRWPFGAATAAPNTWGDLTLAPLLPAPSDAGSLFLDGRSGYLVVPYSPELNPEEITIEAWVKPLRGDCGTLAGNGQMVSYWLALCEFLQFGYGGETSVMSGQLPVGDGWYHVALTMNEDGERNYYLDGQLDINPGWEPEHERRPGEPVPRPRLGASDRMLRIGSDRNVPGPEGMLHAYVHDLRIWDHVRTQDEIREAAFESLTGSEPGLVALWPFTTGFQDLAGGHDAGVVGNASLAREAPDVTEFPEPPVLPPYDFPEPDPVLAWDGVIPTAATDVNLDGWCGPSEYGTAAHIPLEPDRILSVRVQLTDEGLYLCTGTLWGEAGGGDRVVVLIDRSGAGGEAPGPAHLRLELTPGGQLIAGTGDGSGFSGPAPQDLRLANLSGDEYSFQEDIRPIQAPWWAGELSIPLQALTPFTPGAPLRMAISYDGTFPEGSEPGQLAGVALAGGWPGSFTESMPATWGQVLTGGPPVEPERIPIGPEAGSGHAANLHSPPTTADFYKKCPDISGIDWADPTTWVKLYYAVGYAAFVNKKWPMVDPDNHPIVRAEGTLQEIEMSWEDSPFIHDTHDLDMFVKVQPEYDWVKLQGKSTMVIETESGGVGAGAIPTPGDHVTAVGRWIFDCGHSPKTEIHPVPILESDYLTTGAGLLGPKVPLYEGGPARAVRVARVWMNSDPGGFGYEFNGPFSFTLDLPDKTKGGVPFIKIVQGDASKVSWTQSGDEVIVTITPPAKTGKWFWKIYAGYLTQSPTVYTDPPLDTYNVVLKEIDVKDDHDDYVTRGDGDWYYFVRVNDTWSKMWSSRDVDDDDDPYSISGESFATSGPLEIQVTAYENDSQDDTIPWFEDESLSSGTWSGDGLHLSNGKGYISTGDWKLSFNVISPGSAADEVEPIMSSADVTFWQPRLLYEPNDVYPTNMGVLTVPELGASSSTFSARLTEKPLAHNNVFLLGSDLDRFNFQLDDYAILKSKLVNTPANVKLEFGAQPLDPKYTNCPPKEALGDASGWFPKAVVSSSSPGSGDTLYTFQVDRSPATLSPDWGEVADLAYLLSGSGGRVVDLPSDVPVPEGPNHAAYRHVTMPCAWQHIIGDVDYYAVLIPPFTIKPKTTECDSNGQMYISGGGKFTIPALGKTALGGLLLSQAQVQSLGGHMLIQVEPLADSSPKRNSHILNVDWWDTHYYTQQDCELKKAAIHLKNFLQTSFDPYLYPGLLLSPCGKLPPPCGGGIDPQVMFAMGSYGLWVPELPPFVGTSGPAGASAPTTSVSLLISSSPDQPVSALLYDGYGVLVAESDPLTEDERARLSQNWGMAAWARLSAEGLTPGTPYVVHYVPEFEIPQGESVEMGIGISSTVGTLVWPDVDCSSAVNSVDSLQQLRYIAGLPVNQNLPCPEAGSTVGITVDGAPSQRPWGDADCNGAVNAVDALQVLRHVAGLPANRPPGCPPLGADVEIRL